ncbi:Protein of unknown function [Pyronema omphalodes CBS 100304]|uniref:Uncharacterized protein n=1 Tax=Pyronema omphalodes (strain CBS 100304) TaxID=1076935 RepID=U4LHG2_PYROM|nr:Protein of unknown function [Pyronema omphalodes CBS 100304]
MSRRNHDLCHPKDLEIHLTTRFIGKPKLYHGSALGRNPHSALDNPPQPPTSVTRKFHLLRRKKTLDIILRDHRRQSRHAEMKDLHRLP